jgi:glutaredoxin 3
MTDVTIYTTQLCGYCSAARRLLNHKGVAYNEIDVTFNREARADMMSKANGGRTTPQIFVGEHHVGGCDELYEMDEAGKLDILLASDE